jgi:tripartite-type tricarboxylate transporter receptor subunit TctC
MYYRVIVSFGSLHERPYSGSGISDQGGSDYHSLVSRRRNRLDLSGFGCNDRKIPREGCRHCQPDAGGAGAVGYTEAMQAKPDGYTLVSAITPLTILPHRVKTAYTYASFEPIINVVKDPGMFLVRSDAPWKSLEEFLEYAKKNPEMITVGNSGTGGGVHLIALAFENAAGVTFNHIPFAGGGPSVTALLGGHINAVSVSPPEGIEHVKAGRLKIIALFSEKRFEMFPDVKTVKEQGIDFVMGQWRGLVSPKGTPPDVVNILHDAFKKGMDDPVFQKNAEDMAINLYYLGPEDFGKLIAREHELFGKLIQKMKK